MGLCQHENLTLQRPVPDSNRVRIRITLTSWWVRWRLKSPAPRLSTQPLFRSKKHQSSASLAIYDAGNSSVTDEFPAQMASNAENVSIWWRHHGQLLCLQIDSLAPVGAKPSTGKLLTEMINLNLKEFCPLTHGNAIWRLRTESTLTRVMACYLVTPSNYLNQCW